MKGNVLKHEPHIALFTRENAIGFYEKIAKFALANLTPNDSNYIELNEILLEEMLVFIKKQL